MIKKLKLACIFSYFDNTLLEYPWHQERSTFSGPSLFSDLVFFGNIFCTICIIKPFDYERRFNPKHKSNKFGIYTVAQTAHLNARS